MTVEFTFIFIVQGTLLMYLYCIVLYNINWESLYNGL